MRIKRLTYFDYPKMKRLVSYLCSDTNEKSIKSVFEEPIGILNAILPLELKFRPESYILLDGKEVIGVITTVKTPGNPYKINIIRLIFKENMYEAGKLLVEYVVQRYGAKGAKSFNVVIDECHDELFDLFINGCGFRQCASEILWKIHKPKPIKENFKLRYAQNTDSKQIAQMYNDEIISVYKSSMTRHKKEFQEPFFLGFRDGYKTRYLTEEDKKVLGYYSITTNDNLNYIIDITTNSGYNLEYSSIINFLLCEITSKKRAFFPLIKQKKYMKNSEDFENYLKSCNYTPIQTSHILVKDYYQPILQENSNWNVFNFTENEVTAAHGFSDLNSCNE